MTFRWNPVVVASSLLFAVFIPVFVGTLADALRSNEAGDPIYVVASLAALAVAIVLTCRCAMMAVVVSESVVTIRNPFWTYRISYESCSGIEVDSSTGYPRVYLLRKGLRGIRRIEVCALRGLRFAAGPRLGSQISGLRDSLSEVVQSDRP